MKPIHTIVLAVALSLPVGTVAFAQTTFSTQAQIAQALSPLPRSLRAEASVFTYDAQGNPIFLRWGNNNIYCMPNQPGTARFQASCFGSAIKAERDFAAKEKAEGKDPKTIQADIAAARAARKLGAPPIGAVVYNREGKSEDQAHELWVIRMPDVKADTVGLPTAAANGQPWMMRSGAPQAHLMVPLKGSMNAAM
ncbi:MAG: hypothetical protein ACREFW_07230 [Rhizomicrobium sp.]